MIAVHSPSLVARSLLAAAGRPPANHTILEENLATILHHFEADFVSSLADLPEEKRLDALVGCYGKGPLNLATKISREIRMDPYTDQQVHQRLDHLESVLSTTTRRVLEENGDYPCRFYVTGSLVKGRFGANSDLDLLVAASPEWMDKNWWQVGMQEDVSIQCLQGSAEQQAEKVESFAKSVAVTPEELCSPGFLHGLFRDSHAAKGLRLENGSLVASGPVQRQTEPDKGYWGMGGMV
ncbi:MAG: nucleotidyltransferase domain-containing protein [Vulcanimicrobiota bacterium]